MLFQSLDQGSIDVSKVYILDLVDNIKTVKYLLPVPWIHQHKVGMGVWIS